MSWALGFGPSFGVLGPLGSTLPGDPLPSGGARDWWFWGFPGVSLGLVFPPNPRRTLRPRVTGYAGRDFLPLAAPQSDILTWDFSTLLAGETIAGVVAFVLEAADDSSALSDSAPGSRLMVGPIVDITRTQVSARVGNFQQSVPAVNYRLGPIIRTPAGNVFDSWSILPVLARNSAAWSS